MKKKYNFKWMFGTNSEGLLYAGSSFEASLLAKNETKTVPFFFSVLPPFPRTLFFSYLKRFHKFVRLTFPPPPFLSSEARVFLLCVRAVSSMPDQYWRPRAMPLLHLMCKMVTPVDPIMSDPHLGVLSYHWEEGGHRDATLPIPRQHWSGIAKQKWEGGREGGREEKKCKCAGKLFFT